MGQRHGTQGTLATGWVQGEPWGDPTLGLASPILIPHCAVLKSSWQDDSWLLSPGS